MSTSYLSIISYELAWVVLESIQIDPSELGSFEEMHTFTT